MEKIFNNRSGSNSLKNNNVLVFKESDLTFRELLCGYNPYVRNPSKSEWLVFAGYLHRYCAGDQKARRSSSAHRPVCRTTDQQDGQAYLRSGSVPSVA